MVVSACSLYVGSETGLFKGVNLEKKTFQNFNSLDELNREKEITALCWRDASEEQLYIGHKNQVVKIFDCKNNSFVKEIDVRSDDGCLRGVGHYNGNVLTATDSGAVRLWSEDGSPQQLELNAGANLYRMRQNAIKPHQIATGGEENDLKIWDLEKPSSPIFKAKNVRNNFLDLRVPVWITDMQFVPSSEKVVTCTRHHHIRLYDPSTSQKRPVISMEFETYPLVSLSLTNRENQVIVGSSRGRMALIDLRRKALVHAYKGFAGSIRYVLCHSQLPIVASCGLDRFLRIHDLNSRKLLSKIYMKSKMNCLLMRSDMDGSICSASEPVAEKAVVKTVETGEKDEWENVWEDMPLVNQKSVAKKRTIPSEGMTPITEKRIKRHKS